MNAQRKINRQEKLIASMRAQIEADKAEIERITEENAQYKLKVAAVEKLEQEYDRCISEANTARDGYREALRELHQMKNEYTKKFKQLTKRLKSET